MEPQVTILLSEYALLKELEKSLYSKDSICIEFAKYYRKEVMSNPIYNSDYVEELYFKFLKTKGLLKN